MKQLRHWTKHLNIDMTECKLNVIRDRDGNPRFMLSYPAKWEVAKDVAQNKDAKFKVYEITEWDEVELVVKP